MESVEFSYRETVYVSPKTVRHEQSEWITALIPISLCPLTKIRAVSTVYSVFTRLHTNIRGFGAIAPLQHGKIEIPGNVNEPSYERDGRIEQEPRMEMFGVRVVGIAIVLGHKLSDLHTAHVLGPIDDHCAEDVVAHPLRTIVRYPFQ